MVGSGRDIMGCGRGSGGVGEQAGDESWRESGGVGEWTDGERESEGE